MSKFFLILIFVIFLACKNSQVHLADERLYNHVDSLITQVLNYEYNEDTFVRQIVIDSTQKRPLHSAHSTFPENPEPRIIVDGYIFDKKDLKKISFDEVKEIDFLIPNDTILAVLGILTKNGIITIKTKRPKRIRKNDK